MCVSVPEHVNCLPRSPAVQQMLVACSGGLHGRSGRGIGLGGIAVQRKLKHTRVTTLGGCGFYKESNSAVALRFVKVASRQK